MESQRVEFHARTIWDSTAPFYWIAINPIYRIFISNHILKYKTTILIKWENMFIYIPQYFKILCQGIFLSFLQDFSIFLHLLSYMLNSSSTEGVQNNVLLFLSYNVDEIRYKLQFYGRLHFFVFVWFKTILWNIQIVYQYRSHCSYIILTDKIFQRFTFVESFSWLGTR